MQPPGSPSRGRCRRPPDHLVEQKLCGPLRRLGGKRLRRVPRHNRRVAWGGEGVVHLAERLAIVVHRQDLDPVRPGAGVALVGGRPERRGIAPWVAPHRADRRERKGEARAQARSIVLGPAAAAVGFDDTLADGEAQAGVAALDLGVAPGRTYGTDGAGGRTGFPGPRC